MRLFMAINFNADTRSRLVALGEQLRRRSRRGNFSLAANLHLTLVFLGECDEERAETAQTALRALRFAPFAIEIERVGRFRRDGGDIWWAGVGDSAALIDVHRQLTNNLIAAGFTLEQRPYHPHITLGRQVVTDAKPWSVTPFGQTVSAIHLMRSERLDGRLTYTPLQQIEANGGEAVSSIC